MSDPMVVGDDSMTARSPRCDGCKWWVPYRKDDGYSLAFFDVRENGDATGLCHRYPPASNVIQQISDSRGMDHDDVEYPEFNFQWCWPATLSSDFCGEFARSELTPSTVLKSPNGSDGESSND